MANSPLFDPDLSGEPSLEEMLAEPIIQLIMHRDGVRMQDMHGTMDRAKRTLANQNRAATA